jgi:hypothetical protein
VIIRCKIRNSGLFPVNIPLRQIYDKIRIFGNHQGEIFFQPADIQYINKGRYQGFLVLFFTFGYNPAAFPYKL